MDFATVKLSRCSLNVIDFLYIHQRENACEECFEMEDPVRNFKFAAIVPDGHQ